MEGGFFLFLHYYDLDSDFEQGSAANKFPYYAPREYRQGLDVSSDGREFCDDEGNCNTRYLMAADRERRDVPQSEIDTIHGLYRVAVPHLDAEMGAFFDELKSRGLYDDSMIIVTSDHGEEFREQGRFIHSQPYDETIRVPLLVKSPGLLGRRDPRARRGRNGRHRPERARLPGDGASRDGPGGELPGSHRGVDRGACATRTSGVLA